MPETVIKGIGRGNNPNSRKNLEGHHWKPGHSGNPKGRTPDVVLVSDELKRLVATGMDGNDALATALARNLVKRALKSSHDLTLLLDRTEGKVTQTVESKITGDVVFVIGKGYTKRKEDADDKPDIQPD